jgi:DNA-binding HxlR family transcriptional regulator
MKKGLASTDRTRSVEPDCYQAEAFCPLYHRAMEIVGRRWAGAVLRAMLAGATRFGEIRGAIPDLTNRMLSERLKDFEAEGIVEREVIPEKPVRVEYHLTEKGRALSSAVEALSEWAEEWVEPAENVSGGG